MFFKQTGVLLFSATALLAYAAQAEELQPFNDYEPPPLLFDESGTAVDNRAPGFLTAIEPDDREEAPVKAKPPQKPKPPAKATAPVKKKGQAKLSSPKKPKTTLAKKAIPLPLPPSRQSTSLEGNRLVTPSARDVLASIEGIKPVQAQENGKVSLPFLAGETALTIDMKNALLGGTLPAIKRQKTAKAVIRAYATGRDAAISKRLSLARAHETREFLTAAGVDAARIDIWPFLGAQNGKDGDRVDVLIIPGPGR
ncbi:MAG: hypothetical protein WBK55_02975 [Alphaproteobacteria bacterium]